jgi:RecB family endonuclease NucS
MRLLVARCEVEYTGRLTAFLPESTRLLMLKADGSVLVHADAGGYKPLNWMTPPTVVEEDAARLIVRKQSARSEDRLEIRLLEVLSDVTHDMGEAAALEKDGVERDLQEVLADRPAALEDGLRLVRREWPTDVGPVDLADPVTATCRGLLAAQKLKPQAVALATARGIQCVEVDLDVLRGLREPELTLFSS